MVPEISITTKTHTKMRKSLILFILILNYTLLCSQPFDRLVRQIDSLLEKEQLTEALPIIAIANKQIEEPSQKWQLESRKQFAQYISENQAGTDAASRLLDNAVESLVKSQIPDPDFRSVLSTQQYHHEAYQGNWVKSLTIALQLQAALEKNPPNKQKRTIDLVYDIAYIHDKMGNVQLSIENYERSIALYETAEKPYENDRALAHNNLASKYSLIERFDKTIYHYSKAVEWWNKAELKDKSYLVSAYNNLIYNLLDYGDYPTAGKWITALNKGYNEWQSQPDFGTQNKFGKANPAYKIKALQLLINLRYQASTLQPALAQNYFNSLRTTYLNCPVAQRPSIQNHYLTAHYILGGMYEKINNIHTAKQYYEAGLAEAKNLNDAYNVMLMQSGIANLLNTSKQYEDALQFTNASLTYFKDQKKFNVSQFSLLALKAMSQQNMGQHKEATVSIDQMLKQLALQFIKGAYHYDSLNIGALAQINSRSVLRLTLNAAMVYRQAATALPAARAVNTSKAWHLYHLAADMFQLYYQKSSYTQVLDQFQKEITEGLLHTISNQNLQDTVTIRKSLTAIINNSNQHLWRQFEAKYASRLTIPNELMEQHRQLRATLYLLQHPGVGNVPANISLQKVLSDLTACENKIRRFDQFYVQQSTHSFNITKIRKLLEDRQGILQYFVTDSAVYGVYFDKKSLVLKKLGSAEALQKAVEQYRLQIITIQPDYRLVASSLYQSFISPFKPWIAQNRLLIVPDRWLEMVPFEALYHQKAGKFLVQEHAVGYAGSLPLFELAMQMEHPNPGAFKLAVFAPEYRSETASNDADYRVGTAPLAYATAEANMIASQYPGRLFAKNEATKANFIATSKNYRIMHFAMHATMDSMYYDSSALVFSNQERVPFAALYQMHLPLDLAVLSACNTGMGKYKPGEGLFGLSRAFTYAGTKSTVHSLWQVPDKETAGIITQLYAALTKGNSKDEALALAKIAFLENALPPTTHPYYWAGFAVSGSMEPIDQKPFNRLIMPISAALLGIGFLTWRHYRVRRNLRSKAEA
jgi:CHAT domain-containing protein